MKVLLLSGADKIGSQPILEVLHELADVTFDLALWAPVTPELAAAAPSLVVWGPRRTVAAAPHAITGTTDATDFSEATETEVAEKPTPALGVRRVKAAARWRLLRLRKALRPYTAPVRVPTMKVVRKLTLTDAAQRCWRHTRGDATVMGWARSADLIVAMDAQSILTAWKLAKRLPQVEVVYGLSAGRGQVLRRLAAR